MEDLNIFDLIKSLGDDLYLIDEFRNQRLNLNLVKDHLNRSVLHIAAINGTYELFRQFVEDGADINAIGGVFDRSPLHYACIEGNVEIVSFLIARPGIDINIKDNEGNTPLYFAEQNLNLDIIKMLQEAGAR